MVIMKCVQCGHEFTVGIFCPECGHKYDADEVARIKKEKEESEKQEAEARRREEEETNFAKMEADKVEELKQRMLSTKKQEERRKMIAEFGTPPTTAESRQRYEALKAKAEQEQPKSIRVNWLYGLTVLIALIFAVALSADDGIIYYVAMAWAGCGFYIWII
jgi:uncharacterized Zn finger protein (UPF0148 family)